MLCFFFFHYNNTHPSEECVFVFDNFNCKNIYDNDCLFCNFLKGTFTKSLTFLHDNFTHKIHGKIRRNAKKKSLLRWNFGFQVQGYDRLYDWNVIDLSIWLEQQAYQRKSVSFLIQDDEDFQNKEIVIQFATGMFCFCFYFSLLRVDCVFVCTMHLCWKASVKDSPWDLFVYFIFQHRGIFTKVWRNDRTMGKSNTWTTKTLFVGNVIMELLTTTYTVCNVKIHAYICLKHFCEQTHCTF